MESRDNMEPEVIIEDKLVALLIICNEFCFGNYAEYRK